MRDVPSGRATRYFRSWADVATKASVDAAIGNLEQDTGWWSIGSSYLLPGWGVDSYLMIRRVGKVCHITLNYVFIYADDGPTAWQPFITLPPGFSNGSSMSTWPSSDLSSGQTNGVVTGIIQGAVNSMNYQGYLTDGYLCGGTTWTTTEPFPTDFTGMTPMSSLPSGLTPEARERIERRKAGSREANRNG